MATRKNPMVQGVVQAVAVAAILAIGSAAVKLYLDVQLLKAKFEYLNGRWDLPAEAK